MSNAAILDVGWAGWWRPRKGVPWTRLAVGDDYSSTWGATLDALAAVHGGESLVTRIDTDPNAAAKRRRRVGHARRAR